MIERQSKVGALHVDRFFVYVDGFFMVRAEDSAVMSDLQRCMETH